MNLEPERELINKIDTQLIKLFDSRFDLVNVVKKIKKDSNVDIFQPDREKKILEQIEQTSKYPEIVKEIFNKIMDESKKLQCKSE